jgi:hypothetical protein
MARQRGRAAAVIGDARDWILLTGRTEQQAGRPESMQANSEAVKPIAPPGEKALPGRDWRPGIAGERRIDGVWGELSWHATPCRHLALDKTLKGAKPGDVQIEQIRNPI